MMLSRSLSENWVDLPRIGHGFSKHCELAFSPTYVRVAEEIEGFQLHYQCIFLIFPGQCPSRVSFENKSY
jgi:hypothetical protein